MQRFHAASPIEAEQEKIHQNPINNNDKNELSSHLDINKTIQNRLGKCEVCAVVDARYTCPKCELKTCSLPCVRIHKNELDCDGKRDRTKYIPLRSMTNMDFMSDYYFLEECTRYVEDRKTDGIKRFTRFNKQLPTHLFRLRAAAHERKTKLLFLLQNFTRHKENTTYYDWKERRIYWRVEWLFMNAGERKYIDERCAENVPLWKLLERYLNAEEAKLQNVAEQKELIYYQSMDPFSIRILLKVEHIKLCRKRFYELDATKTLQENLSDKIIVEFPTIHLYCNSHTDDLNIIDSDEDVQAETKSFLDSLDNFRKEQWAAKSNEAGMQNDEQHDTSVNEEKVSQKEETPKAKRSKMTNKSKNLLFNDDEFSTSSEDEAQKAL